MESLAHAVDNTYKRCCSMESLAHAVDNTYKLCCPIKSKTVKQRLLKALDYPWKNYHHVKKRLHYFVLNGQNKISRDFYAHFLNFVTGQIRQSKKVYYEHKLYAGKNYIKQTWRIILTQKIVRKKTCKEDNSRWYCPCRFWGHSKYV